MTREPGRAPPRHAHGDLTREESGVLGFPSRRGLTPRGSLECNPEILVFPGEEHKKPLRRPITLGPHRSSEVAESERETQKNTVVPVHSGLPFTHLPIALEESISHVHFDMRLAALKISVH